jgi:hypothetical protein
VRILRNHIVNAGQRPPRVGSSNAIDVGNARTVEIAGNIIDRPWHAGINVHCAKISGNTRDVPLSRVLIHHNRVVDGIRTGDDCGNIETWQGGPAYVYNNVSGNPGGHRNPSWMDGKDNPARPGSARFGMAYYLDGAFKNYYFNNIGWGLSEDPWSKVGATTMFQEIISYQNAFFHNTAYNFVKGTRRQAPQAGRNLFLGNVWDGIGDWVFWHTTPARSAAQGNEADAGKHPRTPTPSRPTATPPTSFTASRENTPPSNPPASGTPRSPRAARAPRRPAPSPPSVGAPPPRARRSSIPRGATSASAPTPPPATAA